MIEFEAWVLLGLAGNFVALCLVILVLGHLLRRSKINWEYSQSLDKDVSALMTHFRKAYLEYEAAEDGDGTR